MKYKVEDEVDDYAVRRGREQQLYDQYGRPILNKKKPIGDTNPNKAKYLDAASQWKAKQQGGTGGSGGPSSGAGTSPSGGSAWSNFWKSLGF